jgi:type 1 fimbria pilin
MTPETFFRYCLMLLVCCYMPWANAEDPPPDPDCPIPTKGGRTYCHNQCNFIDGDNPTSSMTFTLFLGEYYVARDAPIGSPIGTPFTYKTAPNREGLTLTCNRAGPNWPNLPMRSNIVAVGPIFPGTLPMIEGRDLTGKVFETSVAGVGVALEMESPYRGPATNQFLSDTGTRLVPFTATNDYKEMPQGLSFNTLFVRALLIKIGPIAPGAHLISPRMLIKGDFSGTPNAYTASVTGVIRQAQCSLSPTDPVSDTPVELGTWKTDDFKGPGTGTRSVPFHINLLNCTDNRGADEFGFATAHLQLDGALGSSIIDPALGLLSLDSTSTASNVGIQMLHADGVTPMPLSQVVPVARIANNGAMTLDFNARFYQLPGTPFVGAGSAAGALSFTLSYL